MIVVHYYSTKRLLRDMVKRKIVLLRDLNDSNSDCTFPIPCLLKKYNGIKPKSIILFSSFIQS